MSSIPCFRDFICDRLTAAAEEIFRLFEKTVLEYEEELSRQRRLLAPDSPPQTLKHDLFQQRVSKQEQEEVRVHLQSWSSSSPDQEDPENSHIKEELQDLCSSQNEEPLVPKQETDAILQTVICDKGVQHENSTFSLDTEESNVNAEKLALDNIMIKSSEVPHPNTDYQLHSNNSYLSQTYNITEEQFESETPSSTKTPKKSYKCETCGKIFKGNKHFSRHQRTHTGERPFSCDMCGKKFHRKEDLMAHHRTHTGEKPYSCDMCGKKFTRKECLVSHHRTHTGEKPFSCDMCGRKFNRKSAVNVHRKIHTGEKPFSCDVCGKAFIRNSVLKRHELKHTGETQLSCLTNEETFSQASGLTIHTMFHAQ